MEERVASSSHYFNVKLIKMTKQYRDGGKKALNNVTLGLNKGIFALLGPNGAGKTTLIGIIQWFLCWWGVFDK